MSIRDVIGTIEALVKGTQDQTELTCSKIRAMAEEDVKRIQARAEDLIAAEKTACGIKVDALLSAIGANEGAAPYAYPAESAFGPAHVSYVGDTNALGEAL